MEDGATITLTVTGTAGGKAVTSATNLKSGVTFQQGDSLKIGGKTFTFDGTTIKSSAAFKLSLIHIFQPWISQPEMSMDAAVFA